MCEADMQWITVQTCEDRASGERAIPLAPAPNLDPLLFPLSDPFGVRKAIVPLFWAASDGDLAGLGTAFSIDPWGGFLTADHVIASERQRVHVARKGGHDEDHFYTFPPDEGFVALLGHGVVFGTCALPQEAAARIVRAWSPALIGDDPMAALQGRSSHAMIDLAVLTTVLPQRDQVHCLPLRGSPRGPRPGELVVAIGFPTINTFAGTLEAARTTIEEGMMVAYGHVTHIHPNGRDRANPTPVFEVEANWPPGMSGAPVLDARGEVVGIVSRSYVPEASDGVGTGWATWLEGLPDFDHWAPTLDPDNADRRMGWAAVQFEPWNLAGVETTEDAASDLAAGARGGYVVRNGSWRLGTDDFII